MENLLNKAKQASDEAEVLVFNTESIPISFENYQIQEIKSKIHKEVSLRVLKDKRIGRTCGNSFSEELVDKAVQTSQFSSPEEYHFAEQKDINYETSLYSEKVINLSLKDLVDTGKGILNKLKGKAAHIPADLYISKTNCNIQMATTNGFSGDYAKTYYEILLVGNTTQGAAKIYTDKMSGDYFEFEDNEIDNFINEYALAEKPMTVGTKKMPVIFTHTALWGLLYRLALGVSGEFLEKKITPLMNKLNEQIFHPSVSINDDPYIPYAFGSMPFDDEGIPTSKKPIIENGVFKNFLYDLRTSSRLNAQPTGNGFKKTMHGGGIAVPPAPYPSNIYVVPGNRSLEDIIKDMPEAIVVKQALGWHSGNLTQGEFSINIGMGYLVKDGKLQGRIVDSMVSGNIYECFKDISEISNTSIEHAWGIYPDIVFNNMSVTGK
ncbi:MAG: TldD/PmbA family protein [Armatimonadota bacterium]